MRSKLPTTRRGHSHRGQRRARRGANWSSGFRKRGRCLVLGEQTARAVRVCMPKQRPTCDACRRTSALPPAQPSASTREARARVRGIACACACAYHMHTCVHIAYAYICTGTLHMHIHVRMGGACPRVRPDPGWPYQHSRAWNARGSQYTCHVGPPAQSGRGMPSVPPSSAVRHVPCQTARTRPTSRTTESVPTLYKTWQSGFRGYLNQTRP
jgi:hypothetical protein